MILEIIKNNNDYNDKSPERNRFRDFSDFISIE